MKEEEDTTLLIGWNLDRSNEMRIKKRNTLIFIAVVIQSSCILFGYFVSLQFLPSMPFYWLWMNYILAGLIGTATHWIGHKHWSGR